MTGEISAEFTAEVTVPDDVAAGSNQVVIEGRDASGLTSRLTLDIVTEAQQPGSVTLESEFPSLSGSTDVDLHASTSRWPTSTNTQLTFGLETEAPAGWTVDAPPIWRVQAASAVVDAGSDATINVTVDPPAQAPAGRLRHRRYVP